MDAHQSTTPTPSEGGDINKRLMKFTDLPFVHRHEWDGKSGGSNWHVPPASNYHEACEVGKKYARQFLEYLDSLQPGMRGCNSLGHIAAAIDFKDAGPNKGYWIGFFSTIQAAL